jgi:hypothetical protein
MYQGRRCNVEGDVVEYVMLGPTDAFVMTG